MNTTAPFKTVRFKKYASELFDGQIGEKIDSQDKPFEKLKLKTCMLMKKSRCVTQFKI